MSRKAASLVTAAMAVTVAAGVALTLARAEPPSPEPSAPGAPPQLGASCAAAVDGALTALPRQPGDPQNRRNLLECTDGSWQTYSGEYPSSDRWLTAGPDLALRGQGVRNPEFMAGQWTGTPQKPDGVCRAVTVDVVAQATDGAPRTVTSDPGQSTTFDASEHLHTVTLTGDCLWVRD